jgi:plasmid stabilization system protein ParE
VIPSFSTTHATSEAVCRSQEAEEDLGDIRAYYLARASARTTRYVMREITKAMGFLARTPGAGHSREDLTDDPVKFWPDVSKAHPATLT